MEKETYSIQKHYKEVTASDFTRTVDLPLPEDAPEGSVPGTSVVTEEVVMAQDLKGRPVACILLSTGDIAAVKKGKGKDVQKASLISGKDENKVMPALMSVVTEINGRSVPMEDLGELDMSDYMAIQTQFSLLNF